MTVKLTKEEFIKRSMLGDRFIFNRFEYYFDTTEMNPFRVGRTELNYNWRFFNGRNEFTVVEPEPKTKIVKEWMCKDDYGDWCIISRLMTKEEAMGYFKNHYKPTGREFEVESNDVDIKENNEKDK